MILEVLTAIALSQAPAAQPAAPVPAPAPEPVFSAEAVQQVIESHREDIEDCLNNSIAERTAEKKALREGPVVVRFVLTSKGTVKAASVTRSVPKSKEFHHCLVKHILSWTFPKPNDGKLHPIEYPFDVKIQK
jgi:TonB family protein